MAARVVELASAVAAAIAAKFSGETVVSEYISDDNLSAISGRKIHVYPGAYAETEPATREKKWRDYTVEVMTRTRYTDAGDIPKSWIDDQMAFVEQVWSFASDERDADLAVAIGDAIPFTTEVTVPYDPDFLREFKVFQSEFTVTYRELI